MSSRALRKAQKQRELEQSIRNEASDVSEDEGETRTAPSKPSAFAMLAMDEGELNDDEDEESVAPNTTSRFATLEIKDPESTDEDKAGSDDEETPSTQSKELGVGKKSKKKKKKKTKKSSVAPPPVATDDFFDTLSPLDQGQSSATNDSALREISSLLSIDTQHLQVDNEMRRLFGRAAFQEDEHQSITERRRTREENIGLAEAVSGKFAYAGPGLPAVLRRRNIFAHGKEDWPRATGGGLNMEVVEFRAGGVTEYSFVHNSSYQNTQREFQHCVMGMDPNSMISLLRFNPYHVSTLLQVSEIAKQEKDYATSGLLLERALFSFGRALHSSFAAKLATGTARLDFRRPENREFWLTVWRYIGNIGMRATWRTAYEWARLLLSLDPDGDHYCLGLVIDQYALRARQPESFLALARSKYFIGKWSQLPNICFSIPLAAKMKGEDIARCQKALAQAIEAFPWVAARLLQEVGVAKIPPSVWGKTAGSEKDLLYTELYATLAKDLWQVPEALAFLTDSAASLDNTNAARPPNTEPISIDEARFVILTDRPALIALVPRSITSTVNSASDPLPPLDGQESYNTPYVPSRLPANDDSNSITDVAASTTAHQHSEVSTIDPGDLLTQDPGRFILDLARLQEFFVGVVPGVTRLEDTPAAREIQQVVDDLAQRGLPYASLPLDRLREWFDRFAQLREVLARQPGQSVSTADGNEATLIADGSLEFALVHTEREVEEEVE